MYSKKYIADVNNAIKKYINNRTVIGIENTKGGIANKVLKITTNDGTKYIFKIYKKKRDHMLANQLIDYLDNNNFNVVKPINDNYIIFENTICLLYPYVENKKTKVNKELENYILKMLECISKFKDFKYTKEHLYRTKCDKEYKFLKNLTVYKLNSKDVKDVVNLYEKIKEKPINNEKEIVHSDISTSNLLTSNIGYYLIDFDETRITSKLYDLMVVLIKFFVKGRNVDFENMKKMVIKYKEIFKEYNDNDYYDVFIYYLCKQLLEKFYDYESGSVDIFSKQQMQDNFKNWIYYFRNLEKFKCVFLEENNIV